MLLIIPQLISISLICTIINNTINIKKGSSVFSLDVLLCISYCTELKFVKVECFGQRLKDRNTQRLNSDEGMLYHLILVTTAQSPHRLARGYESLWERCAVCACARLTTPLFVPYVSKLLLCPAARCLVTALDSTAVVA